MSSSLELLPLELRQKIIECCAKRDLINLAVCCKFLKSEVVPILWREVSIEWRHLVQGKIDTKTSNLKHTRELTFRGWLKESNGYECFNFAFILRNCDPTQLKSLSLSCYIVPSGLQLAAEMLPMLKVLNLRFYREHECFGIVSHFRLLEEVYLFGYDIADEHINNVCLLKNLRILHIETISSEKNLTGVSLHSISKVESLQSLVLKVRNVIPQEYYSHTVANLQHLVHLGLPGSNIEDRFFEYAVGNFQTMENLDISDTKITDAALMSISKLHNLRRLYLTCCLEISDKGIASLIQLHRLTDLSLSDGYITDNGAHHLSKMNSLRSLDLCQCEDLTDIGLEYVSNLQLLDHLNIGCNDNYTDTGFAHIGRLRNLRRLQMGNLFVTSKCFEIISNLCYLEKLYMPYCHNVTDDGVHHLSKLKKLKCLEYDRSDGKPTHALDALSLTL